MTSRLVGDAQPTSTRSTAGRTTVRAAGFRTCPTMYRRSLRKGMHCE